MELLTAWFFYFYAFEKWHQPALHEATGQTFEQSEREIINVRKQ
jgi:hypothetical protein